MFKIYVIIYIRIKFLYLFHIMHKFKYLKESFFLEFT